MAIIRTKLTTSSKVPHGWHDALIIKAEYQNLGDPVQRVLKVWFKDFGETNLSIFPRSDQNGIEWKQAKFFHLCNAVADVSNGIVSHDDNPKTLIGKTVKVLVHEQMKDSTYDMTGNLIQESQYNQISDRVAPMISSGNDLIEYTEMAQANYIVKAEENMVRQRKAKGANDGVTSPANTVTNGLTDADGIRAKMNDAGIQTTVVNNNTQGKRW